MSPPHLAAAALYEIADMHPSLGLLLRDLAVRLVGDDLDVPAVRGVLRSHRIYGGGSDDARAALDLAIEALL